MVIDTNIIVFGKRKKWYWSSNVLALVVLELDPSRFRFTRQTSFVKRHTGLSATPGLRWIVRPILFIYFPFYHNCFEKGKKTIIRSNFSQKVNAFQVAFFRQFFTSVTKVDYLTLRHGFINVSLCALINHFPLKHHTKCKKKFEWLSSKAQFFLDRGGWTQKTNRAWLIMCKLTRRKTNCRLILHQTANSTSTSTLKDQWRMTSRLSLVLGWPHSLFVRLKWIISEWLNYMLICDFLTVKVVNSAAFHCGYALSYSSFSMFMVILIFITTIIFNLKPENNDCSWQPFWFAFACVGWYTFTWLPFVPLAVR